MDNAYDNILSFSDLSHFNEYRRALIGDKGTIANGKLATSMIITYYRQAQNHPELSFNGETNSTPRPKELLLAGTSSRRTPGLVFRKDGFNELISQVISR